MSIYFDESVCCTNALLVSYNFNIGLLLKKKTSYTNNNYCVRNEINSSYVYELRAY